MKIFDQFKDFFFSNEDEEMGMPESSARTERIVREDRPVYAAPAPAPAAPAAAPAAAAEYSERPVTGEKRGNKVVNIQTTAQLQVVLVKPSAFTDAKQIADHLIAKKTVVLNLETASPENKRRIIDFLVGVAYANGGSLKPVANLTYIITPYNVDFIGEDLVGELENNGVFI
ncbi:MAG TPA: cell division protein SepF [Ruminococcus sp.]|jgi:cell division inhibitor SepF|nr:cell division protein SepF [Ruminococcus sp.]